MINKDAGLSIHCHHDLLIEYCTSYDGRVDYIKKSKPIHERKIRLRVFKLLSDEAIAALPKDVVRAYADWQKADADCQKAYTNWQKADADWPQQARDAWHKKWCGCKEWKNGVINFIKVKKIITPFFILEEHTSELQSQSNLPC